MLLVNQDISVPRLSSIHIHNRLVGILHRSLLDPRVDIILRRKLQHLTNILGTSDHASPHLASFCNQSKSGESRNLILRCTNLNKLSIGPEQHEVLLKRHVWAGDGRYNQVERAVVLLGPALCLGSDELGSAHLQRILLLAVCSRDSYDFRRTESLCPQETEVSKAANTNDTDFLVLDITVLGQRTPDCDTSAQHGRSFSVADAVGDLNGEVGWGTAVVGITSVRFAAVWVFAVVGSDVSLGAVVLVSFDALFAVEART